LKCNVSSESTSFDSGVPGRTSITMVLELVVRGVSCAVCQSTVGFKEPVASYTSDKDEVKAVTSRVRAARAQCKAQCTARSLESLGKLLRIDSLRTWIGNDRCDVDKLIMCARPTVSSWFVVVDWISPHADSDTSNFL
jgi:hypothetical protein